MKRLTQSYVHKAQSAFRHWMQKGYEMLLAYGNLRGQAEQFRL